MAFVLLWIILAGTSMVPAVGAYSTSRQIAASATKLETYQQTAGRIASSYEPTEFRPVPWLSDRHLQTIGGTFWRDIPECSNVVDLASTLTGLVQWAFLRTENPGPKARYWDRRERIETPDGDWFHVDHKNCQGECKGVMILIHGLEASSESSLSIDMAKAYSDLGLHVACINFRGCSGEPNDTLRSYHLGFTDDILLYFRLIRDDNTYRNMPVYVSGFSLGGNVLLKALGELKEQAVEEYNIMGAAAFCAPMNDSAYKSLLIPGINRAVYANTLLKSLKQKAQLTLDRCCDGNPDTAIFDYRGSMAAETIFDLENAFIAPVYGFDDTIDYYKKTSCINFLEDVAVPTLILNAEDDPFMDGLCQPTELTHEYGGRAPIKMVHSKKGGHCGFIFHQIGPDENSVPSNSWGPAEMARFISHVMTSA